MHIKSKVRSGIKWTFIQQIAAQSVNYITVIVLARGIPPSYHGLVAIGSLSGTFVGVIGSLGIQEKIIIDDEIDEIKFRTYFWFSVLSGLALSLISFIITLFVSWFYSNNYEANDLLVVGGVLSVTPLLGILNGFFGSNYARQLDFKKISKVNIFATVVTAIIAIITMTLGYYTSALVLRILLGHAILTIVFLFLLKRRIPYQIDWNLIKSIKSFSSFLTLNSIANYMVRNIDYILIGKFFPAEILGQYVIAYKLLLFPLKTVSSKIYAVMLPVLSKNISNPTLFKRLYFGMTGFISFIVLPFTGVIALGAWYWVPIIFPPEYMYLEEMIVILSIVGAIQALISPTGGLYLLKNDTKKMFVNSIWAAVIIGLAFGISCFYGDIRIVLLTYAFTWVGLIFPISVIMSFGLFDFKFIDLFKSSQFSFYGLFVASISFLLFRNISLELNDFWVFVLSSQIFLIVFISVYFLTSKNNPEYRFQRYLSLIKG